jgi:hypothetical protein
MRATGVFAREAPGGFAGVERKDAIFIVFGETPGEHQIYVWKEPYGVFSH